MGSFAGERDVLEVHHHLQVNPPSLDNATPTSVMYKLTSHASARYTKPCVRLFFIYFLYCALDGPASMTAISYVVWVDEAQRAAEKRQLEQQQCG